jgi:hypothetical protein
MSRLLDMQNTLIEDEGDETGTFGHTKPWDDQYNEHVQAESESHELADTQRPKRIRQKPTLLSFDFNSHDRHWTESRSLFHISMKLVASLHNTGTPFIFSVL